MKGRKGAEREKRMSLVEVFLSTPEKKKMKKKTQQKTSHPKQPQRGPEDLHHQDLDEKRRVRRVRQRRRGPHDAHAEAAREVGPPRRQARREQSVAARVRRHGPGPVGVLVDVLDLGLEDNGDDDAVDGDGLAKDDAEDRKGREEEEMVLEKRTIFRFEV